MAGKSRVRKMIGAAIVASVGMLSAAEVMRRVDYGRGGDGQAELPSMPEGERSERVISADGTPIYVDVCGKEGPTVFLLHGWTNNATSWRYQRAYLCDKYRVVAMELRGHGRSGMPEGMDYSIDRMAEDLQAVVEAFDAPEFMIVGHSTGGFTTFKWHERFGELYRDRLKGLVFVDSAGAELMEYLFMGDLVKRYHHDYIAPFLELWRKQDGLAQKVVDVYGKTPLGYVLLRYLAFGKRPPGKEVDFQREMTFSTPLPSIALTLKAIFDFHVEHHLPKMDLPVLILAGSRDVLTTKRCNERTCELLPRARMKIYGGRGHDTMLECPEELNRDVDGFLQECFA